MNPPAKITPKPVFWYLLALLSAMLLGYLLFVYLNSQEKKFFTKRLDDIIIQRSEILEDALQKSAQNLYVLRALHLTSDNVTRNDFYLITKDLLQQAPYIQALEWMPRITADQRADFEAAVRAEGFPDFSITIRESQGNMVPAPPQTEYYPVYYVEPLSGNEAAFGFNVASNPPNAQAIQQALETNKLVATAPITLVQETASQRAFLMLTPVYNQNTSASVDGFMVGVFRYGDFLEYIFRHRTQNDVYVSLYDITDTEQTVYIDPDLPAHLETCTHPESAIRHNEISFANRTWRLEVHATTELLNQYISNSPLIISLLASISLFVIIAVIIMLSTQKAATEQEVQARTIALNAQNERLETINQQLENYTYIISHDLKEPLRSVRTFSQFIMEDYADQFDDEGQDYLERIIKAANRMGIMIDDLLLLSRVGRIDNQLSHEDLAGLLAIVIKELQLSIQAANATVTVTQLPVIVCQPAWMKVLFHNLIGNSLKYRDPDKDSVTVTIDCTERADAYEFSVTDDGQGIPVGQHQKIFGLFRKAHQNKNIAGSGAGLAIVQSIIKEHKGSIWVAKSAPGQGTTIRFTISKELGKEA